MKTLPVLALCVVLTPAAALADTAAADACAAGLSPESQVIYRSTISVAATAPDLRATVKSNTMGLVKAGQIPRGSAKSAAEAAGQCLKLARQ